MSKVIKLGNYKGIEAEVTKQPVADTEVDNEIQRLVAQSTSLIEKDGDVTNGDVTTIDFEGFKDEVAFDGGKAEGFQLEIGSGQFIPGFEEQMIGMKKGETRELNLTFPENYGAADLAGADVVFKVTVHKIEEKKEAELNDAFVASLNAPGIETIDQLRDNIKASLEAQHEQAFMAAKENAALGKLIDDCEVEVEESDIEKALQQQLQHISMELASQGMQLEQYLQMMGMNQETLLQQLAPSAKQQATFEAIIDEIVAIENLETSDEEANQMYLDPKQLLKKLQIIISNPIEGESDVYCLEKDTFIKIRLVKDENGFYGTVNDVSSDILKKKQIQYEKDHDHLTGLLLYPSFKREVTLVINNNNYNHLYAAVMVDLDSFKHINDTYGHDFGDHYLKRLTYALNKLSKSNCLIARRSGDEFCLFIYNYQDKNTIINQLNKLWSYFKEELIELPDHSYQSIKVSGGFVCSSGPNNTIEELMKKSDKALYEAKNHYKGHFIEYKGK